MCYIRIDREDHFLKIINNTEYDVYIVREPVPPKRKRIPVAYLASGTFTIYDCPVDMDRLSFEFREVV